MSTRSASGCVSSASVRMVSPYAKGRGVGSLAAGRPATNHARTAVRSRNVKGCSSSAPFHLRVAIDRVRIQEGSSVLRYDFSPLLNELPHDADSDFRNADGLNVEADRAGDLLQPLGSRQAVFNELVKNQPPFAFAADQSKEDKRPKHPVAQHQRVVLMSARDDEAERWSMRQ